MHFSRLHVCCTLVFFLVLNDREGIDSLNLSSEPNHECNSPSVAGTQHEDQSPLLRYREAVQQNPVRPSGCTTTPKSRLALRRHNGKYNLNLSWPFCRRILKKSFSIQLIQSYWYRLSRIKPLRIVSCCFKITLNILHVLLL